MAQARIITSKTDQKPCVCGAAIAPSHSVSAKGDMQIWLCSRHCGARGYSYQGALRRKVRLDFLGWGEIRRNAAALIKNSFRSTDVSEFGVHCHSVISPNHPEHDNGAVTQSSTFDQPFAKLVATPVSRTPIQKTRATKTITNVYSTKPCPSSSRTKRLSKLIPPPC